MDWINQIYSEIENTRMLLEKHRENDWGKRYQGYADEITMNLNFIKEVRSKFNEWAPLYLYINISNAKNAKKSIDFELRYLGQTVAKLIYRNGPYLTTMKFERKNKRDFGCEIELDNVPWDSPSARGFRSFFKNAGKRLNSDENTGNEEHRLESLFLTEFSKKGNKALSYIQPVKISNIRFPMPTPLSASNHKKTKYSNFHGGGIDLFCRFGKGGVNAKMLVIELKDDNDRREPPIDAIRQAVAYTTFLRELLRSSAGPDWWRLMGRNNTLPDKLMIYAACLMPSNQNNDFSFQNKEFNIDGDIIKLHYMYFNEENNRVQNIETSLVP